MPNTIKVLIVEDSSVARALLKELLLTDENISIIGEVSNGLEAIEFIKKQKPDVVTIDIVMPKMDGFRATREIMESTPIPTIIVSASFVPEEVENTWKAMEAGAVAILEKPKYSDLSSRERRTAFVNTIKIMSQVKVVRRWKKRDKIAPAAPQRPIQTADSLTKPSVIAIGASTGGPQTLLEVLKPLPANFSIPILVVQHITPGFTKGFANWLNNSIQLNVKIAENAESITPGSVYIAPDEAHMILNPQGRIGVDRREAQNGVRPSVSALFTSLADNYGRRAVGVILTGMGRDGAAELKLMLNQGAVTIAQDEESSVIFGMPKEAIGMGGAKHIMKPAQIAEFLINLGSPTSKNASGRTAS
jgi:two-component system, chemotaxis family, protein-glutamate methylesterase/glutaminase